MKPGYFRRNFGQELKLASVAAESGALQAQVDELRSQLQQTNTRADATEEVLLRSAAAEAAEVGADVEGVTETVKILLRSNGDAAEPKRKVDAAMKASAIVPTKQVRRLEFQIEDLEKQVTMS